MKKCDIDTQGEIIDCTKAEQYVVYNFNGFCLLHDLTKLNLNHSRLNKVKNLLNYEDENILKININMNPITRFDDNLFYFYLLNHNNMVKSFENPDIVDGMFTYFHRLNVKIYQYKRKNYKVNEMTTKYSASLNNRKCLNEENYNHNYCHLQCLRVIIKELLDCDFILNSNSTNMNYCSVADLYFIEEIIKIYSIIRKDFKRNCKLCLPQCESTVFEVNELNFDSQLLYSSGFDSSDLVLNLNFNYKTIEIKYILDFELSQLLNYTAGFFGLFFGISFLSIFEIIELIYGLVFGIKFQKKLTRLNSKLEAIFRSKTYENLKFIFQDSEIHGLSQLFSGRKKSALIKIIWFFILQKFIRTQLFSKPVKPNLII